MELGGEPAVRGTHMWLSMSRVAGCCRPVEISSGKATEHVFDRGVPDVGAGSVEVLTHHVGDLTMALS
jgi:hypothetical protein